MHMGFQTSLQEAENVIFLLGLRDCGNRLKEIRLSDNLHPVKAAAILALFEHDDCLNDYVFTDRSAPPGMSGKEATRLYLETINNLYAAAKRTASKKLNSR
jgi:hypothetical protein